jgi:hypothetical protein
MITTEAIPSSREMKVYFAIFTHFRMFSENRTSGYSEQDGDAHEIALQRIPFVRG